MAEGFFNRHKKKLLAGVLLTGVMAAGEKSGANQAKAEDLPPATSPVSKIEHRDQIQRRRLIEHVPQLVEQNELEDDTSLPEFTDFHFDSGNLIQFPNRDTVITVDNVSFDSTDKRIADNMHLNTEFGRYFVADANAVRWEVASDLLRVTTDPENGNVDMSFAVVPAEGEEAETANLVLEMYVNDQLQKSKPLTDEEELPSMVYEQVKMQLEAAAQQAADSEQPAE